MVFLPHDIITFTSISSLSPPHHQIHVQDAAGRTPIFLAARLGAVECVLALCDYRPSLAHHHSQVLRTCSQSYASQQSEIFSHRYAFS